MTPHVLVRVRFFTTAEGGRTSRVLRPYRALAAFDERDKRTMYDFELRFVGKESVELGDQAQAKLIPTSPESWPAGQRGQRVRIHEGPKHVGDAYIEEVHL